MQAGADQVVGRSVDGFACGFPVADAIDGRDALVVVGMNGEPLPIEHGFPVRLVVPGLYGYVSATKWLTEIELTTFAEFDHYWLRRGWAQKAPIKLMSRIDTPRGLGKVAAGTVPIAGVAWAQTHRHRRGRGAASTTARGSRPSSATSRPRTRGASGCFRGKPTTRPSHDHCPGHRCERRNPDRASAPNQYPTAPPDSTRSWSSSAELPAPSP